MRTTRSYRGLTAAEFDSLSPRNRRLLVLGISGGAGDTPVPTADLLAQVEGIGDLNDDDLATLRDTLAARAEELLADPATATDAILAEAQEIATAIGTLNTAEASRAEAAEERATKAAEILASVRGETGDDSGETEVDGTEGDESTESGEETVETEATDDETTEGDESTETEVVEETEKIAASAADDKKAVVTRVVARRPARPAPVRATAAPEMALRASANVPGMQPGALLDTEEKVIRAWEDAWSATEGFSGEGAMRVPVAQLGRRNAEDIYGEDRFLDDSPGRNMKKIMAVTGPAALRASGGICQAPPINYDQRIIGTDARPFRDSGALVKFGADRGGVSTYPAPHLFDTAITNGLTDWTEANDTTPASPTTKNVTTMTCPTIETDKVGAIVQRVKIGNFRARYWREQVEAFMSALGQAHARYAESKWITAVGTGSTQVAHQQVLGTARDILTHLDLSAASMRSRFRMAPNAPLRLAFPDWLYDNIRVDLAREQPGATDERLATSEQQIDNWFKVRNINPSPFIDGETGQIFGAQSAGAAIGWPTSVTCYLYAEGEWLFLDGGELNLGVYRDSTLNGTNDAEFFAETFEGVHRMNIGPSHRLAIDICPNGASSLPIALATAPSVSICLSGS